jgi:hypothetical protein
MAWWSGSPARRAGAVGRPGGAGRAPGDALDRLARQCQAAGGQALAVPTDVTGQSAVTSDAGLDHVRSASPAVDGADAWGAHGGCARNRATRVLTRPMTQPSVAPLTSAIVLGREGLRCVVNDPEHRW